MTDSTATATPPAAKTFADFGVEETICQALADAGIVHPFPIQELTLPLALSGADLIGQARTGTGKTLGFGIPLLQRADMARSSGRPGALVIVPTRELCLQVRDDLAAAGKRRGVRVVALYGGKSIESQISALDQGVEVVVGTPGRLLDLLGRGNLTLSDVTALVLDEADEMLDMGFLPDVEQLIQATAEKRQTLLFSATMPSAVVALARRYMNKPTFLRADVEEVRIAPDTTQYFFSCHRMDKPAVLARILQSPGRGLSLVFTRTKRMADVLVEDLRGHGVSASPIHSDLRQEARERALAAFRKGTIDVLVATEVAARGLDITDVTHVVNYDCPDDEKMYLHRIGRTGRAGAAGIAITLAVWNELARMDMIKKALGVTEPTHEVFSTSEILDELFDLPPRSQARRSAPAAGRKDDDADHRPDRAAAKPARGRSRRTRSDRKARTKTPEAPRAERPAAAKADGGESGGDEVIRRVRTRRRGAETTTPATADQGATQQSDAAASTAPSDKPDRQASAGQRGTRRQSSGSPSRRRRDRSATQGRSDRQDRRRSGQRRLASGGDATAARGNGQPRLGRPMVISYLP